MKIVFTQFFGRNTPHYTTYLFSSTLVMAFFKEATKGGMNALMDNSKILSKVNVPKYLFLLSKNISALVNFVFCVIDNITFGPHMLALLYPILSQTVMNIGVGVMLSVLFVYFRDTRYLYDVFLTLLNYLSS